MIYNPSSRIGNTIYYRFTSHQEPRANDISKVGTEPSALDTQKDTGIV